MKKLSDFKLLDHIITFATVPHKNGYSLKKKLIAFLLHLIILICFEDLKKNCFALFWCLGTLVSSIRY